MSTTMTEHRLATPAPELWETRAGKAAIYTDRCLELILGILDDVGEDGIGARTLYRKVKAIVDSETDDREYTWQNLEFQVELLEGLLDVENDYLMLNDSFRSSRRSST